MELRRMRLPEAKRYVADRLGLGIRELSDSTIMRQLREQLDIGVITGVPGSAKGIEAKVRIEQLLGIEINSVKRLRDKTEAALGPVRGE